MQWWMPNPGTLRRARRIRSKTDRMEPKTFMRAAVVFLQAARTRLGNAKHAPQHRKKESSVSPRERLLKTLAHQEPDRVPLDLRIKAADPQLKAMLAASGLRAETKSRLFEGDVEYVYFRPRQETHSFAPYLSG